MKKLLLTLLCLPLFFSFSERKMETDNNWSEEEKNNFKMECELSLLQFTEEQRREYCSCNLGTVMQNWSTGEEADKAVLKMTMKELIELAEPCVFLLK